MSPLRCDVLFLFRNGNKSHDADARTGIVGLVKWPFGLRLDVMFDEVVIGAKPIAGGVHPPVVSAVKLKTV